MAMFQWFDGYFHWFWPPFTGLKTWLLCVHKFTHRLHKPSPSQPPGWSFRRMATAGRPLWLSDKEFAWRPTTSEKPSKFPKTDQRIRKEDAQEKTSVVWDFSVMMPWYACCLWDFTVGSLGEPYSYDGCVSLSCLVASCRLCGRYADSDEGHPACAVQAKVWPASVGITPRGAPMPLWLLPQLAWTRFHT